MYFCQANRIGDDNISHPVEPPKIRLFPPEFYVLKVVGKLTKTLLAN